MNGINYSVYNRVCECLIGEYLEPTVGMADVIRPCKASYQIGVSPEYGWG